MRKINRKKKTLFLLKLKVKKTITYFFADLSDIKYPVFQTEYLEKKKITRSGKLMPEDKKLYDIDIEDFVNKLSNPSIAIGSTRQLKCLSFGIDFSSFKTA